MKSKWVSNPDDIDWEHTIEFSENDVYYGSYAVIRKNKDIGIRETMDTLREQYEETRHQLALKKSKSLSCFKYWGRDRGDGTLVIGWTAMDLSKLQG